MSRLPEVQDRGEVTTLLRAWSDGDTDAFDRVLPLVYDELHRMAARYLVGERSSISLQATKPNEREHMRQLLLAEEERYNTLFRNLLTAMRPVMAADERQSDSD